MTPSFRIMGGKARLRKWLVSHFPKRGRTYLEPFAGRGNVFFLARQVLDFQNWHLNDIDPTFLNALRFVELDRIPNHITRADFDELRARKGRMNDWVPDVVEPRITFAGKGYAAGYSGSSGTHVGYNGQRYRELVAEARAWLGSPDEAFITAESWEKLFYGQLKGEGWKREDFVYFDPPYLGTKANYPQIDHKALIKLLNKHRLDFRWAVSGYHSSLYATNLNYRNCYEYSRNSEIKGSNSGRREAVTEVLWTNYNLEEV